MARPETINRAPRKETAINTPKAESVFKTDSMEILTGRSNPQLARDVAKILAMEVDEPVTVFKDGESRVEISKNLRGKNVFIIQSTSRSNKNSVNDSVMELYLMASAAARASAGDITAIIPYYGYARQDRKDKSRVTISASDVANLLDMAGVDRILTLDLHAEQTEGSIRKPWDNLYASSELLPAIKEFGTDNMVVVSPDVGGTKRAEKLSFLLDGTGEIAIIHKRRPEANKSMALALVGDVGNKNVIMFDDMIDTAGSIADAARLLKENGAQRIIVAATHGIFTPPALERIENSPIDKIFITDTVRLPERVKNHPKIKVVTVAPLLAKAIKRIHSEGGSLSELIPQVKK